MTFYALFLFFIMYCFESFVKRLVTVETMLFNTVIQTTDTIQ